MTKRFEEASPQPDTEVNKEVCRGYHRFYAPLPQLCYALIQKPNKSYVYPHSPLTSRRRTEVVNTQNEKQDYPF